MRSVFSGYYRPNNDDFKHYWETATFVPDTNVLLDLYRVSENTRSEVMKVFRLLSGRVWLAHQVGLEFHRNRLNVVREQTQIYRAIRESIRRAQASIRGEIGKLRNDSLVDGPKLQEAVLAGLATSEEKLSKFEEDHSFTIRSVLGRDSVLDFWTDLFTERVGRPYSEADTSRLSTEAEERYRREIPPGYKDGRKTDSGPGDYLFWRQVIDWASAQSSPVIIVTSDQKEDWYWKEGSSIVGPRPELIAEMRAVANVDYYQYTLGSFLQHAGKYLTAEVSAGAITEVKDIGARLHEIDIRHIPTDLLGAQSFDLIHLDYHAFDRLIQRVLQKMGYVVVSLADGVGDFIATFSTPLTQLKILVEVKRYTKAVSVDAIRQVVGATNTSSLDGGLLITTSYFTRGAIELAERHKIALIDGVQLNILLRELLDAEPGISFSDSDDTSDE